MTQIRDRRTPDQGTPIRKMQKGTWFLIGTVLHLKAAPHICVGVETGCCIPFNDEELGDPVEVEIHIMQNVKK